MTAVNNYVKVDGYWYHAPYLKEGDIVVRNTERRPYGYGPSKGESAKVTFATRAINQYSHININGCYEYVYCQNIKLDYNNQTFKNTSFKLKNEGNILQLEVNRPTLVQEFGETTVDGKAVRKNIGDPIAFDSASAARVWCTNQITSSIRADNTYRKFSILTETAVAQAKEPEIEFK